MAERLADVEAQIGNVRQIESLVTAIRGIAASRLQNARAIVAGVDAYEDVVSASIAAALSLLPGPMSGPPAQHQQREALVLLCSEQGFAGDFSRRVLDVASDASGAALLIIGARGEQIAQERGLAPVWTASMVTNVDGVAGLANAISDALIDRLGAAVSAVSVVHNMPADSGSASVERRSLMPIDFARFRITSAPLPPLIALPPEKLLDELAGEYVFAALCRALVHSLAAENEARMMAMASAKTNIDERLNDLVRRQRRLWQESITSEVVELSSGRSRR